MEDLEVKTHLDKAGSRACDLSDEVKGLASLCRMVAGLGEQDRRELSEADFVSAMHCVSATMDRYREEVESMVSLLNDAHSRFEKLTKEN